MVGPVAQGEVALLGEDLAGRRGLRAVGHLPGRDDRLADLRHEARPLGEQGGARGDLGRRCVHRRMLPGSTMACRGAYTPHGSTGHTTSPEESHGHRDRSRLRHGGRHDHVCLSFEHDGTTYWFCGRGCMLDFQDDPAKYLAPDHTPSM